MSRRLTRWAIENDLDGIEYEPRRATKVHVVADIMLEFDGKEDLVAQELEEEENLLRGWKLYIDRSSTQHGFGCGVVVITPNGLMLKQLVKPKFNASNNEAEYEALLAGLRIMLALRVKQAQVFNDSLLIVNQVKGKYAQTDEGMSRYCRKAVNLARKIEEFSIDYFPMDENKMTYALATTVASVDPKLKKGIVPRDPSKIIHRRRRDEGMHDYGCTRMLDRPYFQVLGKRNTPEQSRGSPKDKEVSGALHNDQRPVVQVFDRGRSTDMCSTEGSLKNYESNTLWWLWKSLRGQSIRHKGNITRLLLVLHDGRSQPLRSKV